MKHFALALALVAATPAFAQSGTVGEPNPVFPRDEWPACWPAKTATGWATATAETDYGWVVGWWCPNGRWYSFTRPKNPTVDSLAMARLESALLPKLDAIRPAAPRWVVAPNAGRADRPAYYVEAGKLTIAFGQRARVGDACDPSRLRLVVGNTTYAAIPQPANATPVLVAVCREQ